MAHDVFISYAHQDKPTADAVRAGLETRGIRCWMAPRDVLTSRLPSTDWHPAILDAIRGSKLMVVVYSSSANGSGQVKRELDAAVRYEVAILPFRIEDVPVSRSLEWFLSLPHWLDALTPPLEKHIENLASTVRVLVESLSERDGDGGSIAPQPETSDGEGGHGGSIQPPPEISVVKDRNAAVGDLVEQARVALDESRYPDARLFAGQALQIDAGHREAKSLYEAAERLVDVERQLEEARAALRAGSFEQALEPAEAALRVDPQNTEAQGLRAEAEAGIASGEAVAQAAEDAQRRPESEGSVVPAGPEPDSADGSNEQRAAARAETSLVSAEPEPSGVRAATNRVKHHRRRRPHWGGPSSLRASALRLSLSQRSCSWRSSCWAHGGSERPRPALWTSTKRSPAPSPAEPARASTGSSGWQAPKT